MVYKLKENYALRGWEKKSWMLVKRPENQYKVLDSEEFQTLLLCDGNTDFNDEYITDGMRDLVKRLADKEIIEPAEFGAMLDDDQHYRYYDNRFVNSIFWSITGRCNFRCRHCYMDAPEGVLGELSHDEAVNLIDQMAECGVLRVDITGGEPLVRKDFWELIDRMLFYKMTIGQLYTNGWLLDSSVLDGFERRGLRPEISISFDGVGWHDWMRGVPGAETAALKALQLCQKREFPMNVEMCIHKGNKDTLRETINLLANIGVPALKVSNVAKTDLWKHNSDGNELDFSTYIDAVIQYIPFFFQDGMPIQVMFANALTLHEKSKEYEILALKYDGTEKCLSHLLCGAARYACYITPEGRLLPCMPMTACKEQEIFPRIQDIGLKEGLRDSLYMKIVDSRVRDLFAANPKCRACAHKYQCGGGCRAVALEQTGDFMGCDVEQCMLWEKGHMNRVQNAVEKAIAKYYTGVERAL